MVAVQQTEQPVELPTLAATYLADAGHLPVHRFPLAATRERWRWSVSHGHDDRDDDGDDLGCRLGGEPEQLLLSGLAAVGCNEEAVARWWRGCR
jgi:hypothetical protein